MTSIGSKIHTAALEARYDELSYLEGMDPSRASDEREAAEIQDELEKHFDVMNQMVIAGTNRDRETGAYKPEYLASFRDAVQLLEALDTLFA